MSILPRAHVDAQALARAFLAVTDTPSGVRFYFHERQACRNLLAGADYRDDEDGSQAQHDRAWLIALFQSMVGEAT
jgi:hypothetical protein